MPDQFQARFDGFPTVQGAGRARDKVDAVEERIALLLRQFGQQRQAKRRAVERHFVSRMKIEFERCVRQRCPLDEHCDVAVKDRDLR